MDILRIHVYYMNLLIDLDLNREISTSPGADAKASKVTRAHSPSLRVVVVPDTAAREKAVMTRLILAALSGLISAFAAICTTVIYSTILGWQLLAGRVCCRFRGFGRVPMDDLRTILGTESNGNLTDCQFALRFPRGTSGIYDSIDK